MPVNTLKAGRFFAGGIDVITRHQSSVTRKLGISAGGVPRRRKPTAVWPRMLQKRIIAVHCCQNTTDRRRKATAIAVSVESPQHAVAATRQLHVSGWLHVDAGRSISCSVFDSTDVFRPAAHVRSQASALQLPNFSRTILIPCRNPPQMKSVSLFALPTESRCAGTKSAHRQVRGANRDYGEHC